MTNKNLLKIGVIMFFGGILLPQVTSAGIVPCGEASTGPCTICHLIIGFHNLIEWGKDVLVTATVVAIFISGIIYVVSTGNEKMITKAKGYLTASLVGFAITLAAWLIVDVTIYWVANANPGLGIGVISWNSFTCDTTSTALTGGGLGVGITTLQTGAGNLTDAEAKQKLASAGISVTSTGNCSDQSNSNCTSLEGIPSRAIDDIISIKNTCRTGVTVTGGTETGHQSHGTGKAVVDLQWNSSLAQCIKSDASLLNVSAICTTPSDSQYRINCSYDESVEHIHVAFS